MADEFIRSWPSWMPKAQQDGYGYEPIDRRTRTDMEVGSLLRVNFNTDENTVSCNLILDQLQSTWFEAFERDLLNQGSEWFEMPLQTGGFIAPHKVRFKTRPKASLRGPFHTTYTFQLELEKRPQQICPQLLEFLQCVSPTDLCVAGRAMAKSMNEVLPSIDIPDFWVPRKMEEAA